MRITRLAVAVLVASAAVACGGSDNKASSSPTPTQAGPTGTGTGTVHDLRALKGNRWSVATLDLKVGDTVKVTDTDDDVPHNFIVTGVGHSNTMNGGDTFSLTFDKAGTYAFVCSFHESQGMEGTINVS